jgi:FkbM family methyltransferase
MRRALLSMYRKIYPLLEGSGLLKFYPRKLLPIGSFLKSRAIEVAGHKMCVDPKDTLRILRKGLYEPAETALVEREVGQGDIVLDIGANIGYFSLLFARLVGREGRVFAFEPDPGNFSLLKKNVGMNKYDNVTLLRAAVSDANGTTKLYLHECNTMHTIHALGEGRDWVDVDTVRLDDFSHDGYDRRVDFVKMDIEGAEGLAIRGMLSLLQSNVGIKVLTEFNPFALRGFGVEAQEFLELFLNLGFGINRIDEQGVAEPVDVPALLAMYDPLSEWAYTNLFCARPS